VCELVKGSSIKTIIYLVFCISSAYGFDHSHSKFNNILKNHLQISGPQTLFNYHTLKGNSTELDTYNSELSAVKKKEFESWNSKQQLAFLINSYNSFTIKLIIDNYPLKSIRDIGGFFSSPWKKKFFTLLEEKQHLDHIEHGIIRVKFKESRIHFAVNCASLGCPPLYKEAFIADKLEEQLDSATKVFITNTSRNRIDTKNKRIYLSKIFKWYGGDFDKHNGSIMKFVSQYFDVSAEEKKQISQGKYKVSFLEYDWSLNEWK